MSNNETPSYEQPQWSKQTFTASDRSTRLVPVQQISSENDGLPAVRPISNFSSMLISPVAKHGEIAMPQPNCDDEALLLTKVNVDLGIFSPEQAERAPELLAPAIRELHSKFPTRVLSPFIVHKIGSITELEKLLENLEPVNGHRINGIWQNKYSIKDINRRAILPWKEPKHGSLRGHDLTTDSLSQVKSREVHRSELKWSNESALNIIDWIIWAQTCKETGNTAPDSTYLNFTVFPQMPELPPYTSSCEPISGAVTYSGAMIDLGAYEQRMYERKTATVRHSVGL